MKNKIRGYALKLEADPKFLSLYQALFIGFQYHCFRCMTVCPAGRKQMIKKRKE